MPVTLDKSTLRKAPDVATGATASGKSPAAYAEGVSNPPNEGQVTSTTVAEPNDAVALDSSTLREAPQTAPATEPPPVSHDFSSDLVKETPWAIKQAGIGAIKSAGSTLNNLGKYMIPDAALRALHMSVPTAEDEHTIFDPDNPVQGVGKSAEQTGEFLVPGLGEEGATGRFAEAFPKLAPFSRIAYNAATSGALNKLQGGDFTTGALAGGAGSGLAEAGKAVAEGLAEGAMGIRKLDRAYGRRPGLAILDETRGFRPENVAASAQSRLDELTPQLEGMVDSASTRPAPRIAGLLPAPENEIPLSGERVPKATRGGLFPAEESLEDGSPWSEAHPNDSQWGRNLRTPVTFLDSLLPDTEKSGLAVPNLMFESGSAHPELSGRYAPPKGTLLSRDATGGRMPVDEFGRVAHPEALPSLLPSSEDEMHRIINGQPGNEPNPIASLRPARSVVGEAMGKATQQNAGGTLGQLTPLSDFLHTRFDTGETIPEMVTPRRLLDLRRGFNNEFVTNWNPETQPGVTGTARQGYHALTDELHNTVQGSKDIDRRISSLIPVAKRAASADLNAGVAQRVADRIGKPTGGMLPALAGGHVAGIPGAIVGAIAPDALSMASPRMAAARALSRSHPLGKTAGWLERLLLGGGLQTDRDQDQQ